MSYRDRLFQGGVAVSCALLLAAAGSAQAGFNVSIAIEPGSIKFTPDMTNPYYMFAEIDVNGYTDPSDPGNLAHLISPTGAFDSHQGTNDGGSSSNLYDNLNDLKSDAAAGFWDLAITDGATAQTFHYSVMVDASNLSLGFVRPITMVGEGTDGVMSSNPTFHWTQDATDNPDEEFDKADGYLVNTLTNANTSSPSLLASDTQWTPDGAPFPEGFYLLAMTLRNFHTPQDLVTASLVLPTFDGEIDSFGYTVVATSGAQLIGMYSPTPGAAGLLSVAGVMAARRRR